MPDLLRSRTSPLRRLGGLAFHLFDLAAYEFLYRLSPARNLRFFNGGYLPLAPDMIATAETATEAPSAMMYHLLLRSLLADLAAPPPRDLIDIGCGQGGGLAYAAAMFPQARLTGTDRNGSAIRLARRNLSHVAGADLRKARGEHIDFPDARFDFVLSVGAPTYFGLARFVAEASRIAAPGATIAFSGGYRQGDHAAIEAEIRAAAKTAGVTFKRYADITPHTFAALKADIPRREALLRHVPWPFRLYGQKWADLPGSAEYDEYATGKRADFAAVLRKV